MTMIHRVVRIGHLASRSRSDRMTVPARANSADGPGPEAIAPLTPERREQCEWRRPSNLTIPSNAQAGRLVSDSALW
jgi:hypothetical protein